MKLKVYHQIFLGILLGTFFGLILPAQGSSIKPLGDLFIRLLKMIIVPLILASMITGVASIGDLRKLGRVGVRTSIYYLSTTCLAVILGLILVNLIVPGRGMSTAITGSLPETLKAGPPSLLEVFLGIVPTNPIRAAAEGDMLGIIFFALFFGGVLTTLGDRGRVIINFFEAVNSVMMTMTEIIMRIAPVGVFALMASFVSVSGLSVFVPLFKYMGTVLLGLFIHGVFILPLILSVFGRARPLHYSKAMAPALATAFSTASSSATLPVTIECATKNARIPERISSFVLPLGATVNMDGTALYESVAAMFIAQAYGLEMSLGAQFAIFVTATLASIGAAGIPGAGLVTMAIVLKAVNLPLEGIALILAVDRLLDMCRTTVNVWGDAVGAAVVSRWEGEYARTD